MKDVGSKPYTAEDIRFTQSKDGTALYAVALDAPAAPLRIKSLAGRKIAQVTLLGSDSGLDWKQEAGGAGDSAGLEMALQLRRGLQDSLEAVSVKRSRVAIEAPISLPGRVASRTGDAGQGRRWGGMSCLGNACQGNRRLRPLPKCRTLSCRRVTGSRNSKARAVAT